MLIFLSKEDKDLYWFTTELTKGNAAVARGCLSWELRGQHENEYRGVSFKTDVGSHEGRVLLRIPLMTDPFTFPGRKEKDFLLAQ